MSTPNPHAPEGLPELPVPAHPTHMMGPLYTAAQMREYARTALAGSGGKPSWIDPERTITYPPPSKEKE